MTIDEQIEFIKKGGVKINGEKVSDAKAEVDLKEEFCFRSANANFKSEGKLDNRKSQI